MTLLTGQPFPTTDPWTDLAPLLVNGWSSRGGAPCAYRVDGNSVSVSAVFWIGTGRVIATGLPALASGARLFSAFAQTASESRPLTVQLRDGDLFIESSHWQWAQNLNALAIDSEVPR